MTTRILSVFSLLKRVGFAVLLLGGSHAPLFGQTWELMDELPEHSKVMDILADAQTGDLFAGTARIFGFPECGGIYKYNAASEAWEYKEYRGITIHRIIRLPDDHTYLYACTETGLARSSDGGESWQLFDDRPGTASTLAMSPHDSTLWAVGMLYVDTGRLYLVRNSNDWEPADSSFGWVGGLGFSRTDADILYMATGNRCYSYNLATRIRELLFQYWNFYSYKTLYMSQSAPSIFFLEDRSIFRFDEETSTYDSTRFPGGSGHSHRWAFTPSEMITVATDSMLIEVDSDLDSMRILTPPVPGLGGRSICMDTVSGIRYVGVGNQIYREVPSSANPRLVPENFSLRVFPNPFNSVLSLYLTVPPNRSVSVALFDILGHRVDTIHQGRLDGPALKYAAPPTLSSGIYFVVAKSGDTRLMQKAVHLK